MKKKKLQKDKENLFGKMELFIQVNFIIIKLKAKENINGQTVQNMRGK